MMKPIYDEEKEDTVETISAVVIIKLLCVLQNKITNAENC